jgi:lysophospholipase L1-like esterase
MSTKQQWLKLPSKHFYISGLPFTQGVQWHRFSDLQAAALTEEVLKQSRFPAGAMIRFYSDTSSLRLKVSALSPAKESGVDLMVDGDLWRAVRLSTDKNEIEFFKNVEREHRLLELYLPGDQAISLGEIGVDVGCSIEPATTSEEYPSNVFYGSSIVQGAGSKLSCMNYPSIIARQLGTPSINFGFYGAGRGEPEVVSEILKVPAQTIVFDLGKSFGNQPAEIYGKMLQQSRDTQPDARLVCVTPIYCLRERYDTQFREFSHVLRAKFSEQSASISGVTVIDGLQLLGESDWACFSPDGLHPNEWGYARIADRMIAKLQTINH